MWIYILFFRISGITFRAVFKSYKGLSLLIAVLDTDIIAKVTTV